MWLGFASVLLLPGRGPPDFRREVAPAMGRDLHRASLPAPFSSVRAAASERRSFFDELIGITDVWLQQAPVAAGTVPAEQLGRFAATPVSILGAFAGGHRYYPFAVATPRRCSTGCPGWSSTGWLVRSDGGSQRFEPLTSCALGHGVRSHHSL